MRKQLFFLLTVLAILPACSSSPAGTSDIQVEFSSKDTTRDLTVKPGDTMEIILPVQTGTGYTWAITTPDEGVVRATTDGHEEMSADDVEDPKPHARSYDRVGVVGMTTFHFQAIATGKQVLEFELRRSWEKQVPVAKRVSVLITVK